MNKITYFEKGIRSKIYDYQGYSISIDIAEKVFPPSAFANIYSKYVRVSPHETVIDIGTGTGILGILAAKMGGIVYATDVSKEAIDTAQLNATKNNVQMVCSTGEYFAGFEKKFDVIIVNLPQEIVPQKYLRSINKVLQNTIDGGRMGNELVLEFLSIAPDYMTEETRVYIAIHTLTNYKKTFDQIFKNYSARLLGHHTFENKEYVSGDSGFYTDLNKDGVINIFQQNGNWMADAFVFELKIKPKN